MKNLLKAQQRLYMSDLIAAKKRKSESQFWLFLIISIIALLIAIIKYFTT